MKQIYSFLYLVLILSNVSVGQSKLVRFDSLLNVLPGGQKFNGQILIADKSGLIFYINKGIANEQTQTPITNRTLFNIASLTKQFTALGIVLLQQDRKLSYEDKITKFFPKLKNLDSVTIRNLLNNTSGIPNLATSGEPGDKGIIDNLFPVNSLPNNNDLIQELAISDIVPVFRPGTKYEYSNTNYVLLASVIEKVSGKNYSNYLQRYIFYPLKMTRTFVFRQLPNNIKTVAIGYMKDTVGTKVKPESLIGYEPFKRVSGLLGSAGIYSTASDLYSWITGFKTLLSKQAFLDITTPPVFSGDEKYDEYGFGFELGYEKDFSRILFHSGRFPGYSSYIEYAPLTRKTIILLQNNYNEGTGELLEGLKQVLYDIKPHQFITLDSNHLKELSGIYKTEGGRKKEIVFIEGKLYIAMNPQVRLELQPISRTHFVVEGFKPEVQYEFVFSNGKALKFINTQPENNIRQEAYKEK